MDLLTVKKEEVTDWNDVQILVDIIEDITPEQLKCNWHDTWERGEFEDFKLDDRTNAFFQYHNLGIYIEVKNIYVKNDKPYFKFDPVYRNDVFPTRLEKAKDAIFMFIEWFKLR